MSFLNGVAATACFVAGILFLRFWRETMDRLFLWFALAFWMFAINWSALALVVHADETRHYLYLIRLAGFALILIAVIEKNRNGSGHDGR